MQSIHQEMVALVPRLRRYARGLTNHTDAADDLVQDCLARALAKLELWDEGSNLQAWLFTIMHNIYMNDLRKQKHWTGSEDIDDHGELSDQSNPLDLGLYTDQVMSMVAKLPVPQREVLLLVAVEGMSYTEVAEILGIPIGTVMSRLHRAREQLRMRMGEKNQATIRRVK